METDTLLDLDHLTPEQQQKLNDLFAGIQYLREDAWAAVYAPELMTQELFDYIQLRRLEIGPELENIAMDMFLKYPDFAMNYANRLEKTFSLQNTTSENSPCKNIRQGILSEFGYDIGNLAKDEL
ncbi:MAG: hypothetical protein ACLRTI_00300 [Blautia sp.]|jgi:hypothetical protein